MSLLEVIEEAPERCQSRRELCPDVRKPVEGTRSLDRQPLAAEMRDPSVNLLDEAIVLTTIAAQNVVRPLVPTDLEVVVSHDVGPCCFPGRPLVHEELGDVAEMNKGTLQDALLHPALDRVTDGLGCLRLESHRNIVADSDEEHDALELVCDMVEGHESKSAQTRWSRRVRHASDGNPTAQRQGAGRQFFASTAPIQAVQLNRPHRQICVGVQ